LWRRRSPTGLRRLVLELHVTDVHGVTLAGAGPFQGPVDTEPLKPVADVLLGVGRGDVGEGDGPLCRSADDTEVAARLALDPEAFWQWLVDHERLGHRLGGPRLRDQLYEAADQRTYAVAGDGRDPVALPRQGGDISLRANCDARPLEELGLVPLQLVEQHPVLLGGVDLLHVGEVDEHEQSAGPFDVAQELMPEPAPLGRPLDE